MSEKFIRTMTIEDVDTVDDLLYKTWLNTYVNDELGITEEVLRNFLDKRFKDLDIEHRQKLFELKQGDNSRRMVIEVDGVVAGMCVAIKRKDFNQLQVLYVLPEYQGMGLGRALWEESLKFFDKEKKIIVQVASYNKKAIKFYESLGFAMSGPVSIEKSLKLGDGVIIPESEMTIEVSRS